MSDASPGIQYADHRHRSETAIIGMWLFLASEMLFFGPLLLSYAVYRHAYAAGFAAALRRTDVLIGICNTVLLISSSAVLSLGLLARRDRSLARACLGAAGLGLAFLVLKGVEYTKDWHEHLVPGAQFAAAGLRQRGAELFYVFYYAATGLHAVHMTIGVIWLLLLARWAGRPHPLARDRAPFEVAALYWSFVDIIWITLFPLIYLVGRAGR